jgi:hypothetical protein
MEWGVSEAYWQAITQIEAQAVLIQLRVASYTKTRKQDRSSWHRELFRQAYPTQQDNRRAMTTAELAAQMRGMGV